MSYEKIKGFLCFPLHRGIQADLKTEVTKNIEQFLAKFWRTCADKGEGGVIDTYMSKALAICMNCEAVQSWGPDEYLMDRKLRCGWTQVPNTLEMHSSFQRISG